MKQYEEKSITSSVVDVDDTTRRVKVVMNEMGIEDLDGDVIDNAAFNRTIKQRGPSGVNLIWHLTDHRASLKDAVGKPKEITSASSKLIFVTDIAKTTWGDDVLEFYKSGTINQHSIGFRTLQSEPVNAGRNNEYRLIKEILLYEGSAVLWGANPETPTLSVGKSITKEQNEKKYFDSLAELNNLAKLLEKGKFSDGAFEMIELRVAQLTQNLKHAYEYATRPAEKSAPDSVKKASFLSSLKTFNKTLTTDHEKKVSAVS